MLSFATDWLWPSASFWANRQFVDIHRREPECLAVPRVRTLHFVGVTRLVRFNNVRNIANPRMPAVEDWCIGEAVGPNGNYLDSVIGPKLS